MLARLRDILYRAIVTPKGDSIAPVRIPKDLARRLNTTLGRPLATKEEIARRSKARARLQELRATGPRAARPRVESAPVVVYFEEGRHVRELKRIEALLEAKAIAWTRLDVGGDEATRRSYKPTSPASSGDSSTAITCLRLLDNFGLNSRLSSSGLL
jgi:hypothetical protein